MAESHAAATDGGNIIRSHGYSYFGDLKYAADFTHFDYVNPDAPKGGEMILDALGTFDSLNPYSRKGRASGTWIWETYESLLDDMPADAYGENYGLLAESLEYDEGKNWVVFHMRPEAKFSDGTPVTAHDVVFSHNLLLEQGLPSYAQAVKIRILTSEALDDHTVKFTFAPDISRRSLIDQAGGVPVWSKAWYEKTGARLDESRLEVSPGSGPYVLHDYEVNRRVVYRRNPDYWGHDLPINRGRHNFDEIRIEYYGDDTAAFEAFKAGQYTFRQEGDSKTWATSYDFPAVQKGWVKREEIPTLYPPTPSGFVFNLGREKLQDKRLREALALAYNFEWTNESLQYGLFKQRNSFVENAPHQAKAAPEGAERALLTSLGDLVPAEMLQEPAVEPHSSKPARPNDRRNLRRAMALLDEAGWSVQGDGLRQNAKGEVLTIDFPYPSSAGPTLGPVIEAYARNLAILGVDVNLEKIDPAQYTLRSRERDYDMVFDSYRTFLEAGTGLMQQYGSTDAAISLFNPAGLASPMVDAIIEKALQSESAEEETAALMALDRALRFERFMVPVWYNPNNWVAYWDMYEHPDPLPPYDLGYLDFWWFNAKKAAKLKSDGALR
ncbi:extracellular solute-binding protein [Rhodalgimonas zhirmunskyi]|uniref:Extracellular solute-binding protein n=1 Tax=Rhodalgimonas zhirmunskyi TaxID=2964767 RepID=A0AAJ1UAJ6_9RHOB|nr:extracellular solute-binding protein [Rhodoalgimonas zhirmunskyi]MDQ2094173.1 extracellular solute-binding protein [Rhodoalgimonas zhirmunskyi]